MVRITVAHNQSKQEVMQSVDRSFDELLRGLAMAPLQLVDERRSWQGSTLTFSMNAKLGFLTSPVKGTIEVTDRDITIATDFGLLERLISASAVRKTVEARVRGLLT